MPNHPGFKELNSDQKALIAKELDRRVINKRYAHPSDMDRAAGMFYYVAHSGFQISGQIDEMLSQSQGWSNETSEKLNTLADSAESVATKVYEEDFTNFVKELKSKEH